VRPRRRKGGNDGDALDAYSRLHTWTYLLAFIGFGIAWRGRELTFRSVFIAAMVLLAIGVLLTFPPAFAAFGH
jgi:hypothetical protein